MFLKYIIKRGEESIVIKFDLRTCEVQIGGYFRFINLIHAVMDKPYFNMIKKENDHTQKNKVRYRGALDLKDFNAIIELIKEDFHCQLVRRVNRLI